MGETIVREEIYRRLVTFDLADGLDMNSAGVVYRHKGYGVHLVAGADALDVVTPQNATVEVGFSVQFVFNKIVGVDGVFCKKAEYEFTFLVDGGDNRKQYVWENV